MVSNEFILCSAQFAIAVSVAEMLQILEYDTHSLEDGLPNLYDLLMKHEKISEVDYNGHFGPNIFVTLDHIPSEETKQEIVNIIQKYLDI